MKICEWNVGFEEAYKRALTRVDDDASTVDVPCDTYVEMVTLLRDYAYRIESLEADVERGGRAYDSLARLFLEKRVGVSQDYFPTRTTRRLSVSIDIDEMAFMQKRGSNVELFSQIIKSLTSLVERSIAMAVYKTKWKDWPRIEIPEPVQLTADGVRPLGKEI